MIHLSPPPFSTEAIEQFEQKVAKATDCKYALATCNGTAAIHLALLALGIGKGDVVFCPTLTFCATANPIVYCGATPIFFDCDDTMCIDPELVEYYIKDICKPKAIIAVDLFGQCANYTELERICDQYDIPLIEDAAEALGASHNGRKAGSFGRCGIISFNLNKIVTTGGGGALVSGDADLIDRAHFYATQAKAAVSFYHHYEIGYNYRMSVDAAERGLKEISMLDYYISKRYEIHSIYREKFPDNIVHPVKYSNYWLSIIECDHPDRVRVILLDKGIETRRIWKPMHMQPVYKNESYAGGGKAEMFFNGRLCLPSHPGLSDNDLEYICKEVKDAISDSR